MNMISQAQKDANRLGFTGVLPNGAKGITKDGDTFSVTLADGSVQKYNKDGSIFTPPTDTGAKPADNSNGNGASGTGAADGTTAKAGVGNTGNGNGASGATGSGNTGNSVFGNGFSQSSSDLGFGMSGMNMNGGFNIDPNKFMGASAGLWGALNLTSLVPLGLGSILGQGMIGKAIGNFANAVGFNFDYSKYFAQYDAQHGTQNGTTVTAGDGQPDTSGTTPATSSTQTPATGSTETPATPATSATPAAQTEQPVEQAQAPAGGGSGADDVGTTQARPRRSGGDGYSVSRHSDKVFWKKSGGATRYYVDQNGKKVEIGGYDGKTYTLNGKTYDAKTGQEIKADKPATAGKTAAHKPATQKAKVHTGGLNIAHPQLNGNFRESGFLNSLKNLNREYTLETTSSGNVYKYENADGQKMEVRFDKAGKPTKVTTHNGHFGSVYDISYHANGQRKHMTHGALEGASNVVWEDWSYDQNGVTTDYVKGARVRNKSWKDGQIYRESHAWNGGAQTVRKIPSQVLSGGSGVTFKEGDHLTWSRSGNNFVRKDSASGETWTFDKNGKLIKRELENGDVKTYNAKGWNYIRKGY